MCCRIRRCVNWEVRNRLALTPDPRSVVDGEWVLSIAGGDGNLAADDVRNVAVGP
jgi:hypothetical protein